MPRRPADRATGRALPRFCGCRIGRNSRRSRCYRCRPAHRSARPARAAPSAPACLRPLTQKPARRPQSRRRWQAACRAGNRARRTAGSYQALQPLRCHAALGAVAVLPQAHHQQHKGGNASGHPKGRRWGMLRKRADLIDHRGRGPGDADAVKHGKHHPAPAHLTTQRPHGAGAGHVQQDEHQIGEGRQRGERSRQPGEGFVAGAAGLLGPVGGLQIVQAQRIEEVVEKGHGVFGNGLGGLPQLGAHIRLAVSRHQVGGLLPLINAVERADHDLFGGCARQQARHCGPVLPGNAHGREHRRNGLAALREKRVIDVGRLQALGRPAYAGQHEQHHPDDHDHLADAENEHLQPLPGLQPNAAQAGQAIGRQLHDKGHGLAPNGRLAQHPRGEQRHHDAQHVQQKYHLPAGAAEKHHGERHIDGQPRRARHEGLHQHRKQAAARVFDDARAHDGRHIATKADDHGHQRVAGQAHAAHEAIHRIGGARHIARVVEKREEQKSEADGRDERDDQVEPAAHAASDHGHHPIGQPGLQHHMPHPADE